MRAMIVIAIMAGPMFMITLSQAAETDKDKSKPSMQQKQGDKEKEKTTNRAVPGGQWERNARADPVPVERVVVKTLRRLSPKVSGRKRNSNLYPV